MQYCGDAVVLFGAGEISRHNARAKATRLKWNVTVHEDVNRRAGYLHHKGCPRFRVRHNRRNSGLSAWP